MKDRIEKLVFDMDYNEFCAMGWNEVAREIEKDLLTHGGDVIIHGYSIDVEKEMVYIEYSLLFHLNQSQKQPEGEEDIEKVIVKPIEIDFTIEDKDREFPVEYKTREEVKKMFEPEKQEEWREELAEIVPFILTTDKLCDEKEFDKLADFISQLRSERTFNKEELNHIYNLIWGDSLIKNRLAEEKRANEIRIKIINLLKEEE